MTRPIKEIQTYYDDHVMARLSGFVEGNDRVELAWQTIDEWTPANPMRILEIGCGIGDICWRMTRRWPQTEVVGLDVSLKSLEIGRKLFGSSRLSFCEGPLTKGKIGGKFDLIVLIDVYEHIARNDRPSLHEAIQELRSNGCRIFLSFPTPRHLAWLKQHHPEQIQPVDEDISLGTISKMAQDTGTEVLLYKEVGVWHEGDYAHAILGRLDDWASVTPNETARLGIKRRIREMISRRTEMLVPPKSERLSMVNERIGQGYYSTDN